MPVAGFIDPITGEQVPTETYLTLARRGDLFLRGVPFHYAALKTMAHERDVGEVSATELLGCARRKFLQADVPYYIQPDRHWRLYRGTTYHAGIECQTADASGPDFIAERRFRRTVSLDGHEVPVSGQVDMYWPSLGIIADHKDKSYAAVKGPPEVRHVWQMSIYAWIIAGDPGNDYPIPTEGGIYYADAKRPVLKRFPLLPLDQVETFVIGRLREFVGFGGGVYPAQLSDPEEVETLCRWCPVADHCAALAREGR